MTKKILTQPLVIRLYLFLGPRDILCQAVPGYIYIFWDCFQSNLVVLRANRQKRKNCIKIISKKLQEKPPHHDLDVRPRFGPSLLVLCISLINRPSVAGALLQTLIN